MGDGQTRPEISGKIIWLWHRQKNRVQSFRWHVSGEIHMGQAISKRPHYRWHGYHAQIEKLIQIVTCPHSSFSTRLRHEAVQFQSSIISLLIRAEKVEPQSSTSYMNDVTIQQCTRKVLCFEDAFTVPVNTNLSSQQTLEQWHTSWLLWARRILDLD